MQHWLSIGDQPHLYPLARIESLHPRYAAVLADTNAARILVFATGEIVAERRNQRRQDQAHVAGRMVAGALSAPHRELPRAARKEVVDALEKIVQQENITEIIVAGDEVVMPLLREQMPKHLAEKVVDHVRMNMQRAARAADRERRSRRCGACTPQTRAREGRGGDRRVPLRRARRGRTAKTRSTR